MNEFAVSAVIDTNVVLNTVAENAANGTTVGIVASVFDADATINVVTYSLDNSAGGRFAIDSATGLVSVANGSLLHFETATSHAITIRATSVDGSATTQIFTINVLDQNEAPTFSVVPNLTINENAAVGTIVGGVSASDTDSGDVLTYAILSSNPISPFAINAATGQIRVVNSSLLNF